ncbi:MAG: RNA methyltransferase [Planctomycetota bacterium]
MGHRPTTAIESVANPRLKSTLQLRKSRQRRASGLLLAEGRREVSRAFAAGLVCRELWTCEPLLGGSFEPLGEIDQAYAASSSVLRKLAWHDEPEGIVGVFEAPRWSLSDLLPTVPDALLLVAVDIEKPGNLGAMVRTAAAAGCRGVLAVGPAIDVFNPAAIRNSTAAVFGMPVVAVPDAEEALDWLEEAGVSILSAVAPEQGGGDCFVEAWTFPAAVVVGPEHAGLSPIWRDRASALVTIPMAGHGAIAVSDPSPMPKPMVDSLNASTAAAVLLYEAVRRRSANRVIEDQ